MKTSKTTLLIGPVLFDRTCTSSGLTWSTVIDLGLLESRRVAPIRHTPGFLSGVPGDAGLQPRIDLRSVELASGKITLSARADRCLMWSTTLNFLIEELRKQRF